MSNVIGLDISLVKTGICLPDGTTTVSTGGNTSGADKRLQRLYTDVQGWCSTRAVELAIIEDLPTNAQGAGYTGQAQGVARLVLQQFNIPYVTVVASTLKKFATGSGRADKVDMWNALPEPVRREIAGAAYVAEDVPYLVKKHNDEVDAWWLWKMGNDWLAGRPVPEVVNFEPWIEKRKR